MPLHIKDEEATAAVRALAKARKLTLTEAVKTACQEALERDQRARPVSSRLAAVHARVRAIGRTGERADKAFFDREWGEAE
jgi:antitoxin VapB